MADSSAPTTTSRPLHPVARRCLVWGILTLVAGSVLMVYAPDIYVALSGYAGSTATAGLDLVNVVLTLVRWSLMPLGASLIAASIVIQTLAPLRASDQDSADADELSAD